MVMVWYLIGFFLYAAVYAALGLDGVAPGGAAAVSPR